MRGPAPGEAPYRPADLVDFLLHRSFRNYQQVHTECRGPKLGAILTTSSC